MKRIVAALFAVNMMAASAYGAEITMMSGLYRANKIKNGLETTNLNLGARYIMDASNSKSMFGELGYDSVSYGGTGPKPDNHSLITVGGGMYYWLPKIESRFVPFITGRAGIESGKIIEGGAIKDVMGVKYGMDFGIRFAASETYFVDFQTALFTSYLTRTKKDKAANTEETDTQIFVNTAGGGVGAMQVAFGMKI